MELTPSPELTIAMTISTENASRVLAVLISFPLLESMVERTEEVTKTGASALPSEGVEPEPLHFHSFIPLPLGSEDC
jgi:hypothetical protein